MRTLPLLLGQLLQVNILQIEVDVDVIQKLVLLQTPQIFIGDFHGAFGGRRWIGEQFDDGAGEGARWRRRSTPIHHLVLVVKVHQLELGVWRCTDQQVVGLLIVQLLNHHIMHTYMKQPLLILQSCGAHMYDL